MLTHVHLHTHAHTCSPHRARGEIREELVGVCFLLPPAMWVSAIKLGLSSLAAITFTHTEPTLTFDFLLPHIYNPSFFPTHQFKFLES